MVPTPFVFLKLQRTVNVNKHYQVTHLQLALPVCGSWWRVSAKPAALIRRDY